MKLNYTSRTTASALLMTELSIYLYYTELSSRQMYLGMHIEGSFSLQSAILIDIHLFLQSTPGLFPVKRKLAPWFVDKITLLKLKPTSVLTIYRNWPFQSRLRQTKERRSFSCHRSERQTALAFDSHWSKIAQRMSLRSSQLYNGNYKSGVWGSRLHNIMTVIRGAVILWVLNYGFVGSGVGGTRLVLGK